MRIVLAPDKFKGCLTAAQVAGAMAVGIRRVRPDAQLDLCPMSDGGEGFVDAMVHALGGRFIIRRVTGPLPEIKVDATFGVVDRKPKLAIIEMSAASGLALLNPDQYNPEATTTFGTGELLAAAVDEGCSEILLGIGGSATIDGGIGCCQAAGLPVILEDGEPLSMTEPLCGRDLPRVVLIKSHRGEKLAGVQITVACDVTNPLCGEHGAAAVFGPQKGATPQQVAQFDEWLAYLARRCNSMEIAAQPGAGAAGGLGFAMMAFFGAKVESGADLVIGATNLIQRLSGADLCITGEGRFDDSSLSGKAAFRVAELCKSKGVRCAAIVGSAEGPSGRFDPIMQIVARASSTVDAMKRAKELIADCAAKIASRS